MAIERDRLTPRVNPLRWEEVRSDELAGGVYAEAGSPIGRYFAWGTGLWAGPDQIGGNHRHDGDLLSAQAAAQADFERRILSALSPSPHQQKMEN